MSGHSKWASIKHKKGAADAKRGKIFTQAAKLITIAAQKGGDPDMNPTLRAAIDKAKEVNVPNANIDRAIKRGTGELKEGAEIQELSYEGYGPGGVALLIQTLTDNKNRTVAEVKNILSKNGGRMADAGSVAWMFEHKGLIMVAASANQVEEIELQAIDWGAEDVKAEGGQVEIVTALADFIKVKEAVEKAEYLIESAELAHIPKNEVAVTDEATARKILKLMNELDDSEDVSAVASNFDIADELMAQLG